MIMVGRTPVLFMSKQKGSIETSMYVLELCATKNEVKDVQSVRYMLHCLGVKVTYYSLLCGDNGGVIQNITISDIIEK